MTHCLGRSGFKGSLSLLLYMVQVLLSLKTTIVAAGPTLNFTLGIIMLESETTTAVSIYRDLQYYQGLLLFQQQLNDDGGITVSSSSSSSPTSGKILNVNLLYEVIGVSGTNLTETTIAAQTLVDNSNVGALTCTPDVGLSACAQVAADASMIFFSSLGSDEMCSGPKDEYGNKYDYTYCPQLEANTYYTGIMNEAALQGYTKTAIFWVSYNTQVLSITEEAPTVAVEYGLEVLFSGPFDTSPVDYAADGSVTYDQGALDMFIEARDAGVEVMILYVGTEAVYAMEMLKSINYAPAILWVPIVGTYDTWYNTTGALGNYVTSTTAWHHSMTYEDPFWGDTQSYTTHFQNVYGTVPTEWNALGSVVGVSLALAIQKGGGVTPAEVNRGLGFVNDETLYGLLRFGQFNRNIGRDPVTVQWIGSNMYFVLPSSIATGELYIPMEPWECRDKQQDRKCFSEVQGVSKSAQVAFTILAAIGIAFCLVALIGVYRKQSTTIFNRASPLFCKLLLIFGIGGYISVMLYTIEPDEQNGDVLCPARTWVLAFSSTGVLASLFAKTWRLYRLFTENKGLVRQRITDKQLLAIMGFIFLGTSILMIGWTADPNNRPHFSIVPQATLDDVGVATCSMDSPWLWTNIAYFLLLNAWGAFLAYKVRKLPSSFNESKYIFFSLYNIFICIVVLLPIGAVMLKDTVSEDMTLIIGIIVAFTSVMVSIIGSKFLLLHFSDADLVTRGSYRSSAASEREKINSGESHVPPPPPPQSLRSNLTCSVYDNPHKAEGKVNFSDKPSSARDSHSSEGESGDRALSAHLRAATAAAAIGGGGGAVGGGVGHNGAAAVNSRVEVIGLKHRIKELEDEQTVLRKQVQELLQEKEQQQMHQIVQQQQQRRASQTPPPPPSLLRVPVSTQDAKGGG